MKRFISILLVAIFIISCDDGNLTIEKFNFDTSVAIQKCENKELYYKISNKEVLLLQIPESSFINEVTPVDEPREILINSSNKLLYRLYNENVSSDNFCATIPTATPSVIEEWSALNGVANVSGIIQITTTAIKNSSTQEITGFNHYVVFKNVTFKKDNQSFVYEQYVFGNFTTSI